MSGSVCRTCGAAIFWAKTVQGNAMPIDQRRVAGGNILLVNGLAMVQPTTSQAEGYQSHYVSCRAAAAQKLGA